MSPAPGGVTESDHSGLLRLSAELNHAKSISESAAVVVEIFNIEFDAPLSAVWQYDKKTELLEPVVQSEPAQGIIGELPTLPPPSLAGRAYDEQQTKHIRNVPQADSVHNPDTTIQSEIIVPIPEFGVVTIGMTDVDAFSDSDARLAELAASNLEAAVNRIRREQQSKTEHEWRQILFEGSRDAILVSDTDGSIIEVNTAACTLSGYDRSEIRNQRLEKFLFDGDSEAYQSYQQRVLNDESLSDDISISCAEGDSVAVSYSSRRVEVNNSVYVHTTVRDISEKHARREQLASLESAIDEANDGVAIIEDGKYTYVDETHLEFYGYDDKEQLLGENLQVIYDDPAKIKRIESDILPTLRAEGYWRGIIAGSNGEHDFPSELSLTRIDESRIICIVRDVTEKHRRVQELRQSERRFKSVFEDPQLLVGLTDTDGTVIDINQRALTYVSADYATICGKDLWKTEFWNHDEELVTSIREWVARAADGEYITYESEIPDEAGDTRYLSGTVRPVTDVDGVVQSLLITAYDVTQSERRQQELESFQQAIEQANDGVAILGDDGYDYVDQTHADMYGFESPADLLGESWHRLYDEEEAERLRSEAFESLESTGYWRGEVTGTRPDGSSFPAEISLTAVEHGSVVCTVRDETERKKQKRNLQRERQQFELLTESIDEYAFIVLDKNGTITSWNDGAKDLFGYSPETAVGMSATALHPDSERRENVIQRLLTQASIQGESAHEGQRVCEDGSTFYADVRCTPVKTDDESFLGYGLIVHNLTEKRRQQQRTERFVEESVDVVTIADEDGTLSYVSAASERVLGYDSDTLSGTNIFDYVHVDEQEAVMNEFVNVIENPAQTSECEFRFHAPDDTWLTVNARARNYTDDKSVGGVLIYIRDISQIKKRARRFEAIFNQQYQVSGLLDTDGTILRLNNALSSAETEIADDSQIVQFSDLPLWTHSDELVETIQQSINRAADGKSVQQTLEAMSANGLRLLDLSVRPITNSDGDITLLVVEARDITTQERKRRHLQVLQRVIRHNIRNDITKLRGFLDLTIGADDHESRQTHGSNIHEVLDNWEMITEKTQQIQKLIQKQGTGTEFIDAKSGLDGIVERLKSSKAHSSVCLETTETVSVDMPNVVLVAVDELVQDFTRGVDNTSVDTDTAININVELVISEADWVTIRVTADRLISNIKSAVLESGEETQLEHAKGLSLWLVNVVIMQAGGSIAVERTDNNTIVTIRIPTRSRRKQAGAITLS
jgi:PAS domain S-box